MNTYWSGNGRFQDDYEKIKHLIPIDGTCETLEGELLRAAGRLYYEYYNNGFCNNVSGPKVFLKKHGFESSVKFLSDDLVIGRDYCDGNHEFDKKFEELLDEVIVRCFGNLDNLTPNDDDMWNYTVWNQFFNNYLSYNE